MKIKYEFANETIEIEVSDEWGNIILEMDREEYNNEKKENRRTLSLDIGFDAGGWNASTEYDPLECVCAKEDTEKIESALTHLNPHQADVFRKVCMCEMGISEYARSKRISKQAASKCLIAAKNNFKKFYKNG